MQSLSESEWDNAHSLNYVADGWSICVLAQGGRYGRTTWRIHGKREGLQFHATGATLAEAWKSAALQAMEHLASERPVLHEALR